MEFYKSRIVPGEFNKICERIHIELFNSGFRFFIENNLKNQIKLELGVSTNDWKILGVADFPIDLMKINPFDALGNVIYFKLMIYEISNNLLKISAMDPVFNKQFLTNPRFRSILSKTKQRISKIIDHLHFENNSRNTIEEFRAF
jgi:hypothetical protein